MHAVILSISILFFLSYAVLIIYYRRGWVSVPEFNITSTRANPTTRISVIIPARNEAENIGHCLDSATAQSYPKQLYEILVVDDHSTDTTAEITRRYTAKNVKLISLMNFIGGNSINSYKKKAIEIAIQQSTGHLIVTTDADCVVPPNWLLNIASFYEENNAAFIAAPVSVDCNNNFLEIFQSLDFMTLQGITGASVHNKIHSMCNGANLAYEKKAFLEVDGFKGIDGIASGDDMLLMHKIYERFPDRTFFLKCRDVIVHTQPMNTLTKFINQRIRWASKADKYQDKRIFSVLLLVYFFNGWIFLTGVAGLFGGLTSQSLNIFFIHFISLLTCKTIIEIYFIYPVAVFFNKRIILWWFPLAQPFHILYTIIAGWLGRFGSYHWKDRKVK